MKNQNKIAMLLEEKVDEIFLEMQNELGIENGDISPFDYLELLFKMDELTEKIRQILGSQML